MVITQSSISFGFMENQTSYKDFFLTTFLQNCFQFSQQLLLLKHIKPFPSFGRYVVILDFML